MSPHTLRIAAFLLCSPLVARAQDLHPLPVTVDAGPILCFCIADDSSGHRVERQHVAMLDGKGPAVEFLDAEGNTSIVRRLDRTHLLLASYCRPYALLVLDLAAGKLRTLADGAPWGFVGMHGDDVLFLGDERKQQDFLFTAPWREPGAARKLCEARLHRVLQIAGNLAVAVSHDEREVWLISLARERGRRLLALGEGERDARAQLSPSGTQLAIGSVSAEGTGILRVVDAATGELLQQWKELRIERLVFDSALPTLEIGWVGDDVVCDETRAEPVRGLGRAVRVRRSVATGEVQEETAPPAPASPAAEPWFRVASDEQKEQLFRAGCAQPLATIATHGCMQYEDIQVAPDDRTATVRMDAGGRDHLVLFARDSDTPRELAKGWAHTMVWLPAVE